MLLLCVLPSPWKAVLAQKQQLYLGANCIFSHHQCGMTCAARTLSPQYWVLLLVVEFYEWNWQHKKEICQLLNACHRPIYSMCNILMQWTQQNVWVWGKMSTINVLNFYDVTQLKNTVRHMSVKRVQFCEYSMKKRNCKLITKPTEKKSGLISSIQITQYLICIHHVMSFRSRTVYSYYWQWLIYIRRFILHWRSLGPVLWQ